MCMWMLAQEISVEGTNIPFYKQQRFPCIQQTGFFSASQTGISNMLKEQSLPCLTKNSLECSLRLLFGPEVHYFTFSMETLIIISYLTAIILVDTDSH